MKAYVISLAIALFLTACGNYNHMGDQSPASGGGGAKATETTFDFATIKSEILDKHCSNCHEPTDYHANDFDTYQKVKSSAQFMLERIETSNPSRLMPKNGPALPANLKAMFREWVEAGAPEFQNDEPNKETNPTPERLIGFAEVKEKVFKPYNCIACHSQFNDYNTTYLDRSSINKQVLENKMPRPQTQFDDFVPVSDEDKKILFAWIAQGAPEFVGQTPEVNENPELKPNWISLRNQVFGPKCILCHNAYSAGAGADQSFDTYTNLFAWWKKRPVLFNFDKKEGDEPGRFVEAILRDPCDPLLDFTCKASMPLNTVGDTIFKEIHPITEQELKVIQKWIELKLPYNEEE